MFPIERSRAENLLARFTLDVGSQPVIIIRVILSAHDGEGGVIEVGELLEITTLDDRGEHKKNLMKSFTFVSKKVLEFK